MFITPFTKLAERLRMGAARPSAGLRYDPALYQAVARVRPWKEGDVVFDVGANDGRTVHRLMQHLPSPRIVAFEPVAETFAKLADETHRYPTVERFRLALGSESGYREIFVGEHAALNSLYREWSASDRSETIEMVTLDEFLREEGRTERIHLLKIDAEGHDLEVLKGAAETLRAGLVDVIMVEAGFAAPGPQHPSLSQIQDYLQPLNYHLHGIYNQCRAPLATRLPGQGQGGAKVLVYCDALFVNGAGVF